MKKQLNKGFTLIETIVVIGLLALVGTIIVVSLDRVQSNRKQRNYNKVVTRIKSSAAYYVEDDKFAMDELYEEKGFVKISLQTLVDSGLLDNSDLYDERNDIPLSLNSYARAYLGVNESVEYEYPAEDDSYLSINPVRKTAYQGMELDLINPKEIKYCDKFDNCEELDSTKLLLYIDLDSTGDFTLIDTTKYTFTELTEDDKRINIKYVYQTNNRTYTRYRYIRVLSSECSLNLKYTTLKQDVKYSDSEDLSYEIVSNTGRRFLVTLDNQLPVSYSTQTLKSGNIILDEEGPGRVYIYCFDSVGELNGKSYDEIVIDRIAPTCKWSGESTEWRTSGAVKISCVDTNGSGCSNDYNGYAWEYYSPNTIVTTEKLAYTIKDIVNNTTYCNKTANIYVDNVAPTCSWTGESTNWRRTGTITLNCADQGSGCVEANKLFSYPEGTEAKTANLDYNFKDIAGNTTKCNKTVNVYVDSKGPTCSISSTGGWETSQSLRINATDGGIGLAASPYSWNNGVSYSSSNSIGGISSVSTHTAKVKDQMNNVGTCSYTVRSATQYSISTCSSCNSCSSAGCASYNSCPNPACGSYTLTCPQSYSCGCASYSKCQNAACGQEIKMVGGTPAIPHVIHGSLWKISYVNKSCRTRACGCARYKTCTDQVPCGQGYNICATEGCGCARYNQNCDSCGCASWGPYGSWGFQTCSNSNTCRSTSRIAFN